MKLNLRVWWLRNGKLSHYNVKDVEDAVNLINSLADNDLRDESIDWNTGGLEVMHLGGWVEWMDENGDDINEMMSHRGV